MTADSKEEKEMLQKSDMESKNYNSGAISPEEKVKKDFGIAKLMLQPFKHFSSP